MQDNNQIDYQRINLQLDAHSIRLKVVRDKEPFYREAAKVLNERYQYYIKSHPEISAEQAWVYVALEQAINLRSDVREKSLEPVQRKVDELNGLIEDAINN